MGIKAVQKVNKEIKPLLKEYYMQASLYGKDSWTIPYKSLCYDLISLLKLDSTEQENLLGSINYIQSRNIPITWAVARTTVIRVCANRSWLKEGPIPLWNGEPTEAALSVIGVQRVKTRKGRAVKAMCMCLSGLPAGLSVDLIMSENLIYMLMAKKLGPGRKYQPEYTEIGGMLLKCTLEDTGTSIVGTDYSATEYMKKYNKHLMELREDPQKCKTPDVVCGLCKKYRHECKLSPFYAKEVV